MNKKLTSVMLTAIAALTLLSPMASANNIQVTNVTLASSGASWCYVEFDVSWDNSWRAEWVESGTWTNWDAAWVFVKFRVEGGASYSHASLATNDTDHTVPDGATLDVGLTGTNCAGVFIYRATNNSGSVDYDNVKLKWFYDQDGVANTASVDISVHAIEMVYVPEGSFVLGSGGTEDGHFYESPTTTSTYTVDSEAAITTSTTGGDLWGTGGTTGDNAVAPSDGSVIPNEFPKGYAAFYCMKYEISQGQYAEFLNELNSGQKTARFPDEYGNMRHTLTKNGTNYYADVPDRACNYLIWADGAAYADWAGLRPMTELEFEKACRGHSGLTPTANEYAWGNATISATTSITDDGTPQATADNGNCNYDDASPNGPFRVGIYATASSGRTDAGASYWGIMELSGNLFEWPVSVANADGRTFIGTHGDGALSGGGGHTNSDWPATDGDAGSGAGFRGGDYTNPDTFARASDRKYAALEYTRYQGAGWRAVRSAP